MWRREEGLREGGAGEKKQRGIIEREFNNVVILVLLM